MLETQLEFGHKVKSNEMEEYYYYLQARSNYNCCPWLRLGKNLAHGTKLRTSLQKGLSANLGGLTLVPAGFPTQ